MIEEELDAVNILLFIKYKCLKIKLSNNFLFSSSLFNSHHNSLFQKMASHITYLVFANSLHILLSQIPDPSTSFLLLWTSPSMAS